MAGLPCSGKGFLLGPSNLFIVAIPTFHRNPMEPKIAKPFVAGGTSRSLLLRLSMHLAIRGNADLMSRSKVTAPASPGIGLGNPRSNISLALFYFWWPPCWTGRWTYLRPQDLKDFARRSGLDVVYSEVGRDRDGKG